MIAAMKRQGYLLADDQHPPEQLFADQCWALNFGREMEKPVTLNATDTFGGEVILGEFKVLGEADKLPAQKSESESVVDTPANPVDVVKPDPK